MIDLEHTVRAMSDAELLTYWRNGGDLPSNLGRRVRRLEAEMTRGSGRRKERIARQVRRIAARAAHTITCPIYRDDAAEPWIDLEEMARDFRMTYEEARAALMRGRVGAVGIRVTPFPPARWETCAKPLALERPKTVPSRVVGRLMETGYRPKKGRAA